MLHVIPQREGDEAAIENLLDDVFGIDRFQKASYFYRKNIKPLRELSWVALEEDRLVGTVRYWPILVGDDNHPSLLLGPIGIAPDRKGQGIGRALVYRSIERAIELEHNLVLLVGDVAYFQRFGFSPATPLGFVMPGEPNPERLQVMALKDDLLGKIKGVIKHIHVK